MSSSSEEARGVALGILRRREVALRRRLHADDEDARGNRSKNDTRLRDYGAVAGVTSFLTVIAIVLSVEARPEAPLILVTWAAMSAIVWFNNVLYLRGRHLHARQEAARLEYEQHTLPALGTGGVNLAISRVEKLLERLDRQERLLTQTLLRNIFLALVLGVPLLGLAVTLSVAHAGIKGLSAAALFEILSLVAFIVARNRARQLESTVQQADYELSLLAPSLTTEQRAERLYLKQQFELKRYYDEALRQSSSLSYIGAGCVLGGFVIVGVTFALLGRASTNAQVEVAIVGGVGGILANFVAVVFLQMHSGTVRALTSFQNKLVATNHMHLANLLVSRVGTRPTSALRTCGAPPPQRASPRSPDPTLGSTDSSCGYLVPTGSGALSWSTSTAGSRTRSPHFGCLAPTPAP
jgi:hypothetical protein